MTLFTSTLSVMHFIGLALGVGAATTKLVLLIRCHDDPSFISTYLKVVRLISRQIIIGMILLTLSGIGWLLLGVPFSPRLLVKVVMVGAIWVMGPVIDNIVEPRFQKLAPAAGESASAAFLGARRQYLAMEIAATLLFYVIILWWVLR